jgi:hypothetical protein
MLYTDFRKPLRFQLLEERRTRAHASPAFFFSQDILIMTTSAQVAANQANAQRSTGPRTALGKAVSALNNFRHGFSGAFTVLPWESQEEFDMLLGGLRDEHQPSGLTETILVDKMAQALWLTKRAVVLQHITLNYQRPGCDDEKQLALYLRYETTHDRIFHKALNQLLKLRAEKRKSEIGFESQERKRNDEAEEIRRHNREERKQNDEIRKSADQTRREAAEKRKQELHRYNVLLGEAKVDHQELLNMNLRHSMAPMSSVEHRPIEAEAAA